MSHKNANTFWTHSSEISSLPNTPHQGMRIWLDKEIYTKAYWDFPFKKWDKHFKIHSSQFSPVTIPNILKTVQWLGFQGRFQDNLFQIINIVRKSPGKMLIVKKSGIYEIKFRKALKTLADIFLKVKYGWPEKSSIAEYILKRASP